MQKWTTIASVVAPGARHATTGGATTPLAGSPGESPKAGVAVVVPALTAAVAVPATTVAQLQLMFSMLLFSLLQLSLRLLYACREM